MREKIKIKEILSWTKSNLASGHVSEYIGSISTDSRTIKSGEFFLPLYGENYDGHAFIPAALEKGASGFVYELKHKNKFKYWCGATDPDAFKKLVIFQSENNLKFLELVSYWYIRKFKPAVVGITGSVGKTITKDLLVSILSKVYNTKFTPKNFNTEIGVAKSVLEIGRDTDFFIAEFGMRGKGQVKLLSDMCDVDIGVITAVGKSHLEFFKNLNEIAAAKAEIGEVLGFKDGVLFMNADDGLSSFIKKRISCKIVEFGRNRNLDFNFVEKGADNLGRFTFDIYRKKERITEICLNISGYHNIYNACAAAAVCLYLNVGAEVVKEGLEAATAESCRMELIKKGDKIIINDCYNANPLSVRKAVDTLYLISSKNNSRSVAILGDMLELGKKSFELHQEIGKYLIEKKIDVLIALGKLSEHTCSGYINSKDFNKKKNLCFYFKNKESLSKKLRDILRPGDSVLLKGSRANKMESIIDLI